jgi:hypothetical protein
MIPSDEMLTSLKECTGLEPFVVVGPPLCPDDPGKGYIGFRDAENAISIAFDTDGIKEVFHKAKDESGTRMHSLWERGK